jgi:hypothetical protein
MKFPITFSLLFSLSSLFAQPANDARTNATVLTDITAWTSSDAAYTTVDATPDDFGGAPWTDYKNVWFSFEADGPEIDLRVLSGGSKGTLENVTIKLYNSSGTLVKQNVTFAGTLVAIQAVNLTDNGTYYFFVDSSPTDEGTFTLQINNQVNFDNRDKAELLTDLSFSSSPAAYTTVGATPDAFDGAPWYDYKNVWFKFQATTTEIDIRILVGGGNGTLQNPKLKLLNASGDVIGNHPSVTSQAHLQNISLTIGHWYYFYVDSNVGNDGTFSVSISDQVGFDNRGQAQVLTDLNEWTSANASYTNVDATSDDFDGHPWLDYKNVWFKFQATTTQIDIGVLVGEGEGTLQNVDTKFFNSSGTMLATQTMVGTVDGYIRLGTLTPGDWYFFFVDANGSGEGTFTLSVNDNLGFDLKAGALILDHSPIWCSADAFFDNTGMTADETNSSSCSSTFVRNVWFKFRATSTNATVRLQHGASKGTMATGRFFLMDDNSTLIACDPDEIVHTSLTKGSWYYIIVDSGTGGTFTLCLEGGAVGGAFCDTIYCDEDGVDIGTPFVPQGFILAVKGKMIAEGVKVQFEENWPDYVFTPEYRLPPLREVKEYVSRNNHLPGVPSAAEVKQDGVDLADMNAKLLLKIEEMTLYMIKMEERLEKLESNNQALKAGKK